MASPIANPTTYRGGRGSPVCIPPVAASLPSSGAWESGLRKAVIRQRRRRGFLHRSRRATSTKSACCSMSHLSACSGRGRGGVAGDCKWPEGWGIFRCPRRLFSHSSNFRTFNVWWPLIRMAIEDADANRAPLCPCSPSPSLCRAKTTDSSSRVLMPPGRICIFGRPLSANEGQMRVGCWMRGKMKKQHRSSEVWQGC